MVLPFMFLRGIMWISLGQGMITTYSIYYLVFLGNKILYFSWPVLHCRVGLFCRESLPRLLGSLRRVAGYFYFYYFYLCTTVGTIRMWSTIVGSATFGRIRYFTYPSPTPPLESISITSTCMFRCLARV